MAAYVAQIWHELGAVNVGAELDVMHLDAEPANVRAVQVQTRCRGAVQVQTRWPPTSRSSALHVRFSTGLVGPCLDFRIEP
jgi:hypothetical protein